MTTTTDEVDVTGVEERERAVATPVPAATEVDFLPLVIRNGFCSANDY